MKRIFLLLVVLSTIFLNSCAKDVARSISVEEVNGVVQVSNAKGEMDAYVGERLMSGDDVKVDVDSNMTLLIDSDKHLFADAGTHFSLEATGKEKSTKTRINLYEGSALFGIDNKLKADELYEVDTPNATMAVRGTVFKVKYVTLGITTVEVIDGEVEATCQSLDGENTVLIKQGEKVEFSGFSGAVNVIVFSEDDENIGEDVEKAHTVVSSDVLDNYATEDQFLERLDSLGYNDSEMYIRKGRFCRFSELYKEQFDEWNLQGKSYTWSENIIVLDEPIEYDGKQYDKVLCNGRILNDMNEFDKMMGHYFYLYGFISMNEHPMGDNTDFDGVIEIWGEYPPDFCIQDYIYLD